MTYKNTNIRLSRRKKKNLKVKKKGKAFTTRMHTLVNKQKVCTGLDINETTQVCKQHNSSAAVHKQLEAYALESEPVYKFVLFN